jgi:EmrB/QacA subfamily drug resistance transporter
VTGPAAAGPRAGVTIAVACLATAMLMLDISVVNTALSDIASDLDTGLSGLQWVVDAYTLPLAATVLTAGALADRSGRRRAFMLGLGLFTAASAVCGLATTIGALVAARAVQGLGASVLYATALALIAQVTPTPQGRASALAAYGASVGAAFAVGPFIGGALVSALGWRAIFLVNVPLGIAALWMTMRHVAESRDPQVRRVDLPGQVTIICALFLLILALLRGNQDGWGSPGILAALCGGLAFLGLFVVIECRSPNVMLPLGLFRNPTFAGAQIAVFAIAASFFAVLLYTTIYFQGVHGYTPIQTGLVYLPATVTIFAVSAGSAALMNRFPPAPLVAGGLALVAVGLLAMLTTDVDASWLVVMPGSLICAVGTGLFNPAASAAALGALPPERSGLAAGANDTFRQAGVALGIAAFGAFIPASAALGGSGRAYVHGLHQGLVAAAALAAVGALAAGALLARSQEPAISPMREPDPQP